MIKVPLLTKKKKRIFYILFLKIWVNQEAKERVKEREENISSDCNLIPWVIQIEKYEDNTETELMRFSKVKIDENAKNNGNDLEKNLFFSIHLKVITIFKL